MVKTRTQTAVGCLLHTAHKRLFCAFILLVPPGPMINRVETSTKLTCHPEKNGMCMSITGATMIVMPILAQELFPKRNWVHGSVNLRRKILQLELMLN